MKSSLHAHMKNKHGAVSSEEMQEDLEATQEADPCNLLTDNTDHRLKVK